MAASSSDPAGMKPALQFRLHQQLTLTPQLQQAIRLLQLSQLELEAELRQITESNPLLEFAEESDDAEPVDADDAESEYPSTESPSAAAGSDSEIEDSTEWADGGGVAESPIDFSSSSVGSNGSTGSRGDEDFEPRAPRRKPCRNTCCGSSTWRRSILASMQSPRC